MWQKFDKELGGTEIKPGDDQSLLDTNYITELMSSVSIGVDEKISMCNRSTNIRCHQNPIPILEGARGRIKESLVCTSTASSLI